MKYQSAIVVDTSPLLNVIASGQPGQILAGVRSQVVVAEVTIREVRRNPRSGFNAGPLLDEMIARDLLTPIEFDNVAMELFFELVSGEYHTAIGDGEAGAIAVAIANALPVVLDDQKAARAAKKSAAHLQIISSIDLFIAAQSQGTLPCAALSDALYDALVYARMRVPSANIKWVREVLGDERFLQCPSIAQRFRASTTATSEVQSRETARRIQRS